MHQLSVLSSRQSLHPQPLERIPMDVQMERDFCSNFKCCDLKLPDLHALFDHRRTCHPNSDIWDLPYTCDLPYSVPCPGPSPTSHSQNYAFSEFLQVPSTPLPPSPLHLKTLFTREPLPLVSPTASECSSAASSASSSTSPPTSSSSSHFNTRSAHTRDTLYTPVAIPPTLRLDHPREPAASWSISSPASFYYYPLPAPHTPFPPHAPVPIRPYEQSGPQDVEIIDVDSISSPPPCMPTDARPLPTLVPPPVSAPPAPSPSPSPSPSPPPVLEAAPAAADSRRAHSEDDAPPAKRRRSSNARPSSPIASPFVSALKRHFFRPPPVRRASAPAASVGVNLTPQAETVHAGCSAVSENAMETATDADMNVLEDGEALGGGDETLESANAPEVVLINDEPLEKMGAELDSEPGAPEVVRDSESAPVSPISGKPPVYLNGREKPFVCPVPGCIKAYLTPNGLRYHEQKGTCVTKDGNPCVAPLPAEVPIPATVSPAATTSAALAPATPRPKPPRRRPARQSARLASAGKATDKPARAGQKRRRSVSVSSARPSPANGSDSETSDSD
ncbi:hypothetical protein FB451DRAFT_1367612 [Mycena latifolia]|nr:hypothetical protein FB451DRAFT_1367612 [Mycena latifolia]